MESKLRTREILQSKYNFHFAHTIFIALELDGSSCSLQSKVVGERKESNNNNNNKKLELITTFISIIL